MSDQDLNDMVVSITKSKAVRISSLKDGRMLREVAHGLNPTHAVIMGENVHCTLADGKVRVYRIKDGIFMRQIG